MVSLVTPLNRCPPTHMIWPLCHCVKLPPWEISEGAWGMDDAFMILKAALAFSLMPKTDPMPG